MNIRKAVLAYGITHREYMGSDYLQAVRDALLGGITMLQIREKLLDERELIDLVNTVKPICKEFNVPLIVNDKVDVLKLTDVDGVHIGQEDVPISEIRESFSDKIIGVTARSVEEALEAERGGADYVGVGAVFGSTTKDNIKPMTKKVLKEITEAVSIPVCAIGGVTSGNIRELMHTGIDGVAVSADLFDTDNVRKSAEAIVREVSNITIKKVLSIAGVDPSGGAGIDADLKTFTAHKKYGMTVITAITAQNTLSVDMVEEVSPECVKAQIKSVFEDIRPDSVKIGMVSNIEIIKTISEGLGKYHAENVVVDPVMVATSGAKLIDDDAVSALKKYLFPRATIITPNIPEAEILSGMSIKNQDDMIEAAEKIGDENGFAVLVKGGHLINDATDILYIDGKINVISEKRIETTNTHGTGCTLSSAIASNLADGYSLYDSVKLAKKYLAGALKNDIDLGSGSGPLNHVFKL